MQALRRQEPNPWRSALAWAWLVGSLARSRVTKHAPDFVKALNVPDLFIALLEDAVAIAVGIFIVSSY